MIRKLATAVTSTILFSILMGIMNYMSFTNANADDFWAPILYFLMYSAPVYIIAGIPISYIIDRLMNRIAFSTDISRHYTRYGVFIFIGIIAALAFKLVMMITEDMAFTEYLVMYMVGGVIASLIFYYVSLIFDKKVKE